MSSATWLSTRTTSTSSRGTGEGQAESTVPTQRQGKAQRPAGTGGHVELGSQAQDLVQLVLLHRLQFGQRGEVGGQAGQLAEERQNIDWDAVEQSESGEPIEKQYHMMLHYEDTITAESKFEAMQNMIVGNTVVENAKVTVIEIANDLPIEALV